MIKVPVLSWAMTEALAFEMVTSQAGMLGVTDIVIE